MNKITAARASAEEMTKFDVSTTPLPQGVTERIDDASSST
ncbi:helicase-associated domain-containing protein [Rhizobacter sp. OV335]|nr:helicase-associated domain-containing protein [Rhizobacter sp. OV335]